MATHSSAFPAEPAPPVPSTSTASPVPSTSSAPLSPELVQSLHIPWLNLDFPRFSSAPSGPSSPGQPPASPCSAAFAALEQDTLAMRRMKAVTARARPPIFRRRSKSLDDAAEGDKEQAARGMRDEQEAAAAAAAAAAVVAAPIRVDTSALAISAGGGGPGPMSAASFASSSAATTVPTSTTASLFATATTAMTVPSPYLPCPMSVDPSSSTSSGLIRSVSEPMLQSGTYAFSAIDGVPSSLHPPQAAPALDLSGPDSALLGRSYSSRDARLTTWVNSVSVASSLSALPAPAPTSPVPPLLPNKLPLPPRQPYTPVLPSPLSTCSYTSGDDDQDRKGEDGFPFPSTPALPSFAGASMAISHASSEASSPAATSTRSAPVTSPSLLRQGSYPPRPALQSFASASTTATVSSSTTATAAPSPLALPSITASHPRPAASSVASSPGGAAPRPNRASSVSVLPPPARSSSTSSSPSAPPPASSSGSGGHRLAHHRSSSHSLASTAAFNSAHSHSHSGREASSSSSAAYTASSPSSSSSPLPSHTRTTSTSTSSGRHAAPLTPPESLCTGPFLAGASASELAWHDVLGARMGSGGSGGMGAAGGGGAASGYAGLGSASGAGAGGGGGKGKDRATPDAGGDDGAGKREELMGSAAAGGFAASTRERVGGLMEGFLGEVPLGREEEVLGVVEYGAMNSRSASLVAPLLTHFSARHSALFPPSSSTDPDDLPSLSFQITHADRPLSDFRPLAQLAEETYLRSPLATKEDRVFNGFAARPFGAKVVPKGSVSVGFSAMALHWPSTDRKFRVAPATLAHGELMAFLSARATEFKPGGLLTLAYIARSEEASMTASSPSSLPTTPAGSPPLPLREGRSASVPVLPTAATAAAAKAAAAASSSSSKPPLGSTASSPSSPIQPLLPRKKDIWAHLTSVLGKAIQRLVSTGLLKPQVARQLLSLPLHPRTPRQTAACLRASAHSWDTLKSEVVVLSHPAWKGVEHGTVSPESWADHTIQLLKIFWEAEMRAILREALGSRGACEWVLDCLWTVAKEKLEEAPPYPLELEVQLVALRRRTRAPSVPASPVDAPATGLPTVV
ncbi:hypothetical protein JCM8097_008135 [Rhodosporidiobolus ruineniae]